MSVEKCKKKEKNLKNEQLRIASGDVSFNSELGSKNASAWSSSKGFKNCFEMPQQTIDKLCQMIYFSKNEHNKKSES